MKAASIRSQCSATAADRGAAVGVSRCWRVYSSHPARPIAPRHHACIVIFVGRWPIAAERASTAMSPVSPILRPDRLALHKSICRNRFMCVGRRRVPSRRGRLSSSSPRKEPVLNSDSIAIFCSQCAGRLVPNQPAQPSTNTNK